MLSCIDGLFSPRCSRLLCWGSEARPIPDPPLDVHISSDSAAAFLQSAFDLDVESKRGEEVIAFFDEAGVEKGVLLSLGYMFGRPGIDVPDEYAKVRRENDYVAHQAARHPDRLVAFCSVNPLADYAMKELRRCARAPHLEGLKLHLANSGVSLRDSSEIRRLARVFGAANEHRLPIVVHLWTGPEYGRADAERFIGRVLPKAPDVPVQVAHMGRTGMFSETTVEAVAAFEKALHNENPAMDHVLFDLGAVTADPGAALAESDIARANAKGYRVTGRRTARWIERLGPSRVVFGSDYFARSIPSYVETLRQLPVDERVLRVVFDNTAPYLQ